MYAFTVSFIYAIAAAALLSFLYDALLPEGSVKRWCGVAVGIVMVTLIASPVIGLLTELPGTAKNAYVAEINYETVEFSDYERFMGEVYRRALENSN